MYSLLDVSLLGRLRQEVTHKSLTQLIHPRGGRGIFFSEVFAEDVLQNILEIISHVALSVEQELTYLNYLKEESVKIFLDGRLHHLVKLIAYSFLTS